MLVRGAYITWPKQFKPWIVHAEFSSIVFGSALTRCALLHSVWKRQGWTCNEVEFGNLSFTSSNPPITPRKQQKHYFLCEEWCRVTRWSKKFRSGCRNVDEPAKIGKPKIVDSEVVLWEENPTCSTRRVSGELGLSQACLVHNLHDPRQKHRPLPNCCSCTTKILQNIWLTLVLLLTQYARIIHWL